VRYDYQAAGRAMAAVLDGPPRGYWSYAPLLPVARSDCRVTLGEGGTPLIELPHLSRSMADARVWVKDESRNPTWSFKDRYAAAAVSHARATGAAVVTAASTGNLGAATAAYAARAGLPAVVFTMESIPVGVRRFMQVYGAAVVPVLGKDERWALMAEGVRRYGWYPTSPLGPHRVGNPYAVEGYKTIAFEIWQQLRRTPDWVVVPVSSGDGLYGIWKGFWELRQMGLADRIPRMLAAEVNGALKNALDRGLDRVEPVRARDTIAYTIGSPCPGHQALVALRESRGRAVMVDDAAMLDAELRVAAEGVFAEPSSAAAFAALAAGGRPPADQVSGWVVCVMTSAGMKDTASLGACLRESPTLAGGFASLPEYLKTNYGLPMG
jgi:threonine synthase